MKVKLCGNCAYTPQDLEGCYDARSEVYCCVGCPDKFKLITTTARYPKDVYYSRRGNGPRFPKEVPHGRTAT